MLVLDIVGRVIIYGGGLAVFALLGWFAYDFHREGMARVRAYEESQKNS